MIPSLPLGPGGTVGMGGGLAGTRNTTHPTITHLSHSSGIHTWITTPAILARHAATGSLGLLLQDLGQAPAGGNAPMAFVPLQPSSESELNDAIGLHTETPPPVPSLAFMHVNTRTGHAVWSWDTASMRLNAEEWHPQNPGSSLVNFVKSTLPPQALAALNNPPNPPRAAEETADAPLPGGLPKEVFLLVGAPRNGLGFRDLIALSKANWALHRTSQVSLNELELFAFAGTTMLHDHLGNPLLDDNGVPARQHERVLDRNGEPLHDGNGLAVQRNRLDVSKYARYFVVPPNQCLPVLDRNGQQMHDVNSIVVRQMPTLNAAYYTDALALIVHSASRSLRRAALNALSEEIRARPIPEYTVQVATMPGPPPMATVAIPQELRAALESPIPDIRNWAQERLVDAYANLQHPDLGLVMVELAQSLCTTLNGYQPIVVNPPGYASITFGPHHTSMYLSPNPRVRSFAINVSMAVAMAHAPHLDALRLQQEPQNQAHRFPVRRDAYGLVHTVQVPPAYDSWLTSLPLADRRANLEELADQMRQNNADAGPAIARGFAQYLVRNLAGKPSRQMELILFSDAVLHAHDGYFPHYSSPFLEKLEQRGPNGSLPAFMVNEVAARMDRINRDA